MKCSLYIKNNKYDKLYIAYINNLNLRFSKLNLI